MARILLSMLIALTIIYVAPVVIYSVFHAVGRLKVPDGVSPSRHRGDKPCPMQATS